VLMSTGPGTPERRLAEWVSQNDATVRRAADIFSEIWESDRFTVATLSVAVRAIRSLVTGGAAAAPAGPAARVGFPA